MMSQLDLEIHNQLVKYLASEISLEQFRDWFDASTWDVQRTENQATQELAAEIELRLAEYTNGHRREDELRAILMPLVAVIVCGQPSFGVTGTSSVTLSQVADPGSTVDIRREMVFS